MPLDELARLATAHGTDKWNGHRYMTAYAEHLDAIRFSAITLLEIGVGGYDDPALGGASLRTWRDYFPHAQVIGLDTVPKQAHAGERIRIYQGSQSDPRVVAALMNDYPDGFDVIIDDGSHRSEHVLASFLMLWGAVKVGGWYVIEDTQTSYWPHFGGSTHDRSSPHTTMGFLKTLIDGLNWQETHNPEYSANALERTLVGMHFYHNIVFLRKGDNTGGSTVVQHNRLAGL